MIASAGIVDAIACSRNSAGIGSRAAGASTRGRGFGISRLLAGNSAVSAGNARRRLPTMPVPIGAMAAASASLVI